MQILEKSPKYPIMFECWSKHDPEEILLKGLNNIEDPRSTLVNELSKCLQLKSQFLYEIDIFLVMLCSCGTNVALGV